MKLNFPQKCNKKSQNVLLFLRKNISNQFFFQLAETQRMFFWMLAQLMLWFGVPNELCERVVSSEK